LAQRVSAMGSPSPTPSVTGAPISHVAINITGSGMKPIFYGWDGHGNNGAGPNLTFQVPGGSQRLFQVLAVYNNGAQLFYYGGTRQDINADTSVTVNVAQIANLSLQGNVA